MNKHYNNNKLKGYKFIYFTIIYVTFFTIESIFFLLFRFII